MSDLSDMCPEGRQESSLITVISDESAPRHDNGPHMMYEPCRMLSRVVEALSGF